MGKKRIAKIVVLVILLTILAFSALLFFTQGDVYFSDRNRWSCEQSGFEVYASTNEYEYHAIGSHDEMESWEPQWFDIYKRRAGTTAENLLYSDVVADRLFLLPGSEELYIIQNIPWGKVEDREGGWPHLDITCIWKVGYSSDELELIHCDSKPSRCFINDIAVDDSSIYLVSEKVIRRFSLDDYSMEDVYTSREYIHCDTLINHYVNERAGIEYIDTVTGEKVRINIGLR